MIERWRYNNRTGQLYNPQGVLLGVGYSGHTHGHLCEKIPDPNHGEGCNNPEMQNVKDVGPIPCGWFTFGEGHISSHGPMTIPIIPDSETEMFGRSAFLMHGDLIAAPGKKQASLGCIIQAYFVRKTVNESPCKRLEVFNDATETKVA